jgi:hypothetical protein
VNVTNAIEKLNLVEAENQHQGWSIKVWLIPKNHSLIRTPYVDIEKHELLTLFRNSYYNSFAVSDKPKLVGYRLIDRMPFGPSRQSKSSGNYCYQTSHILNLNSGKFNFADWINFLHF